jgi:hypothetical protein
MRISSRIRGGVPAGCLGFCDPVVPRGPPPARDRSARTGPPVATCPVVARLSWWATAKTSFSVAPHTYNRLSGRLTPREGSTSVKYSATRGDDSAVARPDGQRMTERLSAAAAGESARRHVPTPAAGRRRGLIFNFSKS